MVSLIVMVHCSPGFKPPQPYIFVMLLLVLVLLSASFERFGVSRMRDFLIILLHMRNSIDKIILSRNVMSGAGDPFLKRVLSLEIIWCPVPFVFM